MSRSTIEHLSSFTSIPGLIGRLAKLQKHEAEAVAILEGIESRSYADLVDSSGGLDLLAWGAWAICLTSPRTGIRAVSGMQAFMSSDEGDVLSQHADRADRLIAAAAGLMPDDGEFTAAARTYRAEAKARRARNETNRWADALGLALDHGDDWRLAIQLHLEDDPAAAPAIAIDVASGPMGWSFLLKRSGRFSCSNATVLQNDLGLPPIVSLTELPRWLKELENHGSKVRLDESAKVLGSGKRSTASAILEWLRTA